LAVATSWACFTRSRRYPCWAARISIACWIAFDRSFWRESLRLCRTSTEKATLSSAVSTLGSLLMFISTRDCVSETGSRVNERISKVRNLLIGYSSSWAGDEGSGEAQALVCRSEINLNVLARTPCCRDSELSRIRRPDRHRMMLISDDLSTLLMMGLVQFPIMAAGVQRTERPVRWSAAIAPRPHRRLMGSLPRTGQRGAVTAFLAIDRVTLRRDKAGPRCSGCSITISHSKNGRGSTAPSNVVPPGLGRSEILARPPRTVSGLPLADRRGVRVSSHEV
jgi:hypothetical protein